ncbi:MAG TPA: MFS transporter [Sphingomonadaceae bacterium]|nr:MFS transporter [Sphingomonadaceae bacterium]
MKPASSPLPGLAEEAPGGGRTPPAGGSFAGITEEGGVAAPFSKARTGYTLFILILIAAFNYFDRGLLGLLAPLIRVDVHISDTVYGLISGFAFVLFYALLGVPMAALADRVSRRAVIAVGFAAWSLMTMFTGFVTNAFELAATRFLMGAGEACGTAPSNAMINDMFSRRSRARALSVLFAAGTSISSIIFYPIAGWIGQSYGWRTTFIVSGLAGLLLAALVVLTVKEPPRRAFEAPAERSLPKERGKFLDFGFMKLPFILLTCSSALIGAHLNAASAWGAIFLTRVHGLDITEIAVALGPFRGVLTAVGVLMAGYLADKLGKRDARWRLWLPALCCLAVTPSQALFLLGEPRWAWMTGIGLESLFLLAHMAPVYAVAMEIAGPQRRALAVSILLLSSSLVGTSLGPLLVGYLNDYVLQGFGAQSVRYSLLAITLFPAGSALMLFGAGHLLHKEHQRAVADPS